MDQCPNCRQQLAWTKGRGKRAHDPNATPSLKILNYYKNRNTWKRKRSVIRKQVVKKEAEQKPVIQATRSSERIRMRRSKLQAERTGSDSGSFVTHDVVDIRDTQELFMKQEDVQIKREVSSPVWDEGDDSSAFLSGLDGSSEDQNCDPLHGDYDDAFVSDVDDDGEEDEGWTDGMAEAIANSLFFPSSQLDLAFDY